jgi:hypothetical protein
MNRPLHLMTAIGDTQLVSTAAVFCLPEPVIGVIVTSTYA